MRNGCVRIHIFPVPYIAMYFIKFISSTLCTIETLRKPINLCNQATLLNRSKEEVKLRRGLKYDSKRSCACAFFH